MAAPVKRDPEATRQALLRWLRPRVDQAIDIERIDVPPAGASSDTLVVSVRIGAGRRERWIVRIQASSFQIYQDPGVEKQFRVLDALARHTNVPVPRVHWYEADASILGAPFFVMEAVDGQVVPLQYNGPGWLADASPAQRERLWQSGVEHLARVHATDVAHLGFLDRPHLGPTGLDQEIATWHAYLEWVRPEPHPALERGARWLADHAPRHRPTGLAWGDAQIANMIFRDGRCVAVIDWETVSLGGAEEDLAWWLIFDALYAEEAGVPRLPGLGGREATLTLWSHHAGRKPLDMEWQDVFAAFRLAVIMERAATLYAAVGQSVNGIGTGDANPIMRRLARLVAAGS